MGVWIRRSNPVEKAWLDSSLREYDPTTTSRESRSSSKESEMKTDEDDEFDRVKRENAMYEVQRLGQEIEGQPYHFEAYVSPSQRNQVLEEVAKEFDKMPFGDTSQSFATFVRDMKSCPPCHGNCNQGRTCPARLTKE
jgi:hypothetical protein